MVFMDIRSWLLTKLGQVDSTELSIVPGKGTPRRQKLQHENHYA
jgi:hypothetical protein